MSQTAKAKAQPQTNAQPKKSAEFEGAFDAFKGSFPQLDMPVLRDMAEKGTAQARDAYARMKTAAEEASETLEATYETVREHGFAAGLKAIEAAKTNADASFGFMRELFGVKTFADAIELQTAFARKQFEAMTTQFRDFQAITEKAATDVAKPARIAVEKAMKDFKVA